MNGIAFASPWVLAAAAALAVPVLAHLARHEDRRGRGFPSLMFLQRVPMPTRARRRLEDRALLSLRVLAFAALVLAFAGPYPQVDPAGAAPHARDTVVLLDVSASMGAGDRFAQARQLAGAALAEAGAGERAALVLFDDRPRTVSPLGEDPARPRAALDALTGPGHRATDLPAALRHAAGLLAGSDARTRRVVLVSDLQRSGLTSDPSLPRDLELALRSVAPAAGGNLAVVGAEAVADVQRDGERLQVQVRNGGSGAARGTLRLQVDGLDAAREPVALEPGASSVHEFTVFPAADAPTRIELSVTADGDALAADDRRFLVRAARPPLSALLVTHGDGAPFVEAALAAANDPPVVLRRRAPGGLDAAAQAAAQAAADLLILDAPPADGAAPERRFAAAGGSTPGVLVFASALGSEPVAGVRAALSDTPGAGLAMVPTDAAHALSPLFGEGVVALGQVWRRVALDVHAADTVLARFDDGAPAIVARDAAAGRQLVVATAPGTSWSTIARHPAFAPWLARAVHWLAGTPALPAALAAGDALDVAAFVAAAGGEAHRRALAEREPITLRSPAGETTRLSVPRPQLLEEPGLYRLRVGSAAPLWVAVNGPPREADLATLTDAAFAQRVRRDAASGARAADAPPAARDPSWARWLLFLAAALLLLEGLIAAVLASRRRVAVA